jgi:peptidoglycan/LPS O-acetylase OafA/YrhL
LDRWSSGQWSQHLWFLSALSMYTVAGLFLFREIARLRAPLVRAFSRVSVWHLVAGAVACAGLLRLGYALNRLASLGRLQLDWGELLTGFVFFSAGMLLSVARPALPRHAALKVACLGMLSGVLPAVAARIPAAPLLLSTAVQAGAHYILVWCSTAVCILLGARFLARETKPGQRLAASAYTIYLFHHPVCIVLGLALASVSLPVPSWCAAMLKAAAVMSITFAATFALHEGIIRRFTITRVLFNGDLIQPVTARLDSRTEDAGRRRVWS